MRRPVGILVLLAITGLLAFGGGWPLMFYAAWAIAFLLLIAYGLSFIGLRALYFERRTRALRAEVGSYFDERIIVENRSWIPKLWLEIEDQGQHPEHTVSFVVSMGPYASIVRPVHTLCRQRGVFQLGPVFAESGDPFGLFRQRRQIDGSSTFVVYPSAVPLASFGRVDGDLTGGALQGERVPHTTTNVSGVRQYAPGDTFNRIHWKSTARQRQLMVKEFELDPFADIWLVLDLDEQTMVGTGIESVEEYGVTACASLAKYFLDENRAVGLAAAGLLLSPDRGTRQMLKILEVLAFVHPVSNMPLPELLVAEQRRFSRTDTVVVVTGSRQDDWVGLLRNLSSRGVHSQVVLMEAQTFARGIASSFQVIAALAGARIPTYVVKRGEPLQQSLAAPTIGGRGVLV